MESNVCCRRIPPIQLLQFKQCIFRTSGAVYKNLIQLIGQFSNGLEFEWHEKYGWLGANLEILGSGLCCKVYLKLKQSVDCIKEVCDKLRIKITSIKMTENEQIIELTNRHTFGVTEFECVKEFYDSVKEIIQTLVECAIENHMENETQNEAALEIVNESKAQELCENADEANNEKNEGEENEQSPVVEDDTAKNEGSNEEKGDAENAQNEQVSNTKEDNEEKPSNEENVINPPEVSDTNENKTDNLAKGDKANEDTLDETNENPENESEANRNGNETNQSEENSPEKPNDTEDQSVKESTKEKEEGEQPTEG